MIGEILTAGGGFLLAVLWFDLIFDSQVFGAPRDEPLSEPVLASIAGYYRRVTSDADPMGRLVGLAMLGTIAMALVDLFAGAAPLRLAARLGAAARRAGAARGAPRLPERAAARRARRLDRGAEPARAGDRAGSRRVPGRDPRVPRDPALHLTLRAARSPCRCRGRRRSTSRRARAARRCARARAARS